MPNIYPTFQYYAGKRLHIGVCGSISAYRVAELIHRFKDCGISMSVTLTPSARKFITALTFETLGAFPVYTDMFTGLEPFEHLEPGQTANGMLIAPASATSIARIAHGLAGEMLACQALAFDGPVLIAPAMNRKMWQNPATEANAEILLNRGFSFVGPDCGRMACKDEGPGRLARLEQIYLATLKILTEQDLFGQKVMVTLGPTAEAWDAVRLWTNSSSGTMGAALATVAWLRGAEVHAIVGGGVNVSLPQDDDFFVYHTQSTEQMYEQASALWSEMDMGIFTAAVADFRPEPYMQGADKFKKERTEEKLSINFLANQDILKSMGEQKSDTQKIMGFAAESGSEKEKLEASMRRKMENKNCDMIVGNFLSDAIGQSHNSIMVMNAKSSANVDFWSNMPKTDIAWDLISRLIKV